MVSILFSLCCKNVDFCAPSIDGNTCHVVTGATAILLDGGSARVQEVAYEIIKASLNDTSYIEQFDDSVVRAEFDRPLVDTLLFAPEQDGVTAPGSVTATVAVAAASVSFIVASIFCYGLLRRERRHHPEPSIRYKNHSRKSGRTVVSNPIGIKSRRRFVRLEELAVSPTSYVTADLTASPNEYTPSITWSISDITSDSASFRSSVSRTTSKLERIEEADEEGTDYENENQNDQSSDYAGRPMGQRGIPISHLARTHLGINSTDDLNWIDMDGTSIELSHLHGYNTYGMVTSSTQQPNREDVVRIAAIMPDVDDFQISMDGGESLFGPLHMIESLARGECPRRNEDDDDYELTGEEHEGRPPVGTVHAADVGGQDDSGITFSVGEKQEYDSETSDHEQIIESVISGDEKEDGSDSSSGKLTDTVHSENGDATVITDSQQDSGIVNLDHNQNHDSTTSENGSETYDCTQEDTSKNADLKEGISDSTNSAVACGSDAAGGSGNKEGSTSFAPEQEQEEDAESITVDSGSNMSDDYPEQVGSTDSTDKFVCDDMKSTHKPESDSANLDRGQKMEHVAVDELTDSDYVTSNHDWESVSVVSTALDGQQESRSPLHGHEQESDSAGSTHERCDGVGLGNADDKQECDPAKVEDNPGCDIVPVYAVQEQEVASISLDDKQENDTDMANHIQPTDTDNTDFQEEIGSIYTDDSHSVCNQENNLTDSDDIHNGGPELDGHSKVSEPCQLLVATKPSDVDFATKSVAGNEIGHVVQSSQRSRAEEAGNHNVTTNDEDSKDKEMPSDGFESKVEVQASDDGDDQSQKG